MAGWVSYDGEVEAHQDIIMTMTKTMALRGPDAGGVWIDRNVGLGHRRLAVIDLAGGAQPMQAEEQGRTIASFIYTGEVYNFVELRDELRQLGHWFETRSDTEVVLHGYLQWGDGVAERLNGMFAFAIWDVRAEEPFGAKGIGEQALIPTAPAILNAIYDATGIRHRSVPATPDRVRAEILDSNKLAIQPVSLSAPGMTTSLAAKIRPLVSRSGKMIWRLFEAVLIWRVRSLDRRALLELDDHLLRDIGLARADVYREATKPFWRA